MTTDSMMIGIVWVGWIVCTPVPGIANAIESTIGSGSPATHSLAEAPDAKLVLAAMTASRSVHWPSSATVSLLLFTVMVAAPALESAVIATAAAIPFPIRRIMLF